MGFDTFIFDISNYGLMPFCFDMTFQEFITHAKGYSNSGEEGELKFAAGWIVNYDNMDYLKISKDGKCPNGTTPTEQNPRCK